MAAEVYMPRAGGNGEMANGVGRIDSLEDLKQDYARHLGETRAYWQEQRRFNERIHTEYMECQQCRMDEMRNLGVRIETLTEKIGKLNNKMFFWAGGVATLAFVFGVLGHLLSGRML
jgi:hypothetical protein